MHPALTVNSVLPVQEGDGVSELDDTLLCHRLKNSELFCKPEKFLSHLPDSMQKQLSDVIHCYPRLFGDVPTCTDWIVHDTDVLSTGLFFSQFQLAHLRYTDFYLSRLSSVP